MMTDGTARKANSSSFFRNLDCAYFPCHEGVDPSEFNCLFCYCPLYALGPRCGGSYSYTKGGVKDCSSCTRLHQGDAGVAIVRSHFSELAELAQRDNPSTSQGHAGPGKGRRA